MNRSSLNKQTEALKLALEALTTQMMFVPAESGNGNTMLFAITAIREALAEQPAQQQEPVAFTEKQRIYLAQAWAMLDDYALDQRSKGNDSFADGAEASSHEIKMMLSSPPASKPWLAQTVIDAARAAMDESLTLWPTHVRK